MGALSIYEFLIALDVEVSTAWRRRKTVPSVLLLTIRWCMLANGILTFLPTPGFTGCMVSTALTAAFNLVGFAQVAFFSALRVYALADGSFLLPAAVLVLSLVPLGINAYRDSHYACVTRGGTYSVVVHTYAHNALLTILARCTLIAADVIVLAVTWRKTLRQWRSSNRLDMNLPVTTCLVRDGTTHFLILLGMNIINLVGVLTWETKILGLTPMIVYLPPILISRFLLNLRDCTNVCPGGASLQTLSSPGIKLAAQSVLGNIGAPLGCPRDDELSYATDSDAQDENGGVDDLLADATGADPEVCNGAYVARRRAVEGTPDGLSQGFSAKVHKAQEPV